MPKIEQLISVKVSDKGCRDDKRRITVEVTAPADLFNLSDFMVKEGGMKRFRQPLADAVRTAMADYVRGGGDLVKGFGRRNRKPDL